MPRPLPLAIAALLLALAWRTETFQRHAFPERFYAARVKDLLDSIAFERANIRDLQDQLSGLRSTATTPEDASVYLMMRHGIEEDIQIADEAIAYDRAEIAKVEAVLTEIRRDR